jgi:CheY-like chemotaxis protein
MDKLKILLVDDDVDDRSILIDALEVLDAADIAQCAENGEEALRTLHAFAELGVLPCLIVLDLNMPRMNGTETLKRLKADARFQSIEVVIYSTSINPLEKNACMALGAHSYIIKPTSYKESIETAKLFLHLCGEIATV